MIAKRLFLSAAALGSVLTLGSGCVMHRTVTNGGSVVSESYVVKRPIRDAISGEEKSH